MITKRIAALALGLSLAACANVSVQSQNETPQAKVQTITTLKAAQSRADALAKTYGADNVLVVFDVDDTLLSLSSDIGGVAWWDWQESLANTDPRKLPFGERLAIASAVFSLADMEPAEGQTTINVFKHLTDNGFMVYGLTARGPDNRDATLRELDDAGLDFTTAPECGAPLCVKRGILDGDTIVVPLAKKRFGFKAGEKTHDMGRGPIKISSHRNVSVSDGVMMVSGQNKGVMLRLLVDSLPKNSRPKAIVFVDDSAKNVANVEAASPAFHQNLHIFHYQAKTNEQLEFLKSKQKQRASMQDLQRMTGTLCPLFHNQAEICK